jgi:hypothetical protein
LTNDSGEEHRNKGKNNGDGIKFKIQKDVNGGEQASN